MRYSVVPIAAPPKATDMGGQPAQKNSDVVGKLREQNRIALSCLFDRNPGNHGNTNLRILVRTIRSPDTSRERFERHGSATWGGWRCRPGLREESNLSGHVVYESRGSVLRTGWKQKVCLFWYRGRRHHRSRCSTRRCRCHGNRLLKLFVLTPAFVNSNSFSRSLQNS